jgi:hypothetical protein
MEKKTAVRAPSAKVVNTTRARSVAITCARARARARAYDLLYKGGQFRKFIL